MLQGVVLGRLAQVVVHLPRRREDALDASTRRRLREELLDASERRMERERDMRAKEAKTGVAQEASSRREVGTVRPERRERVRRSASASGPNAPKVDVRAYA